MSRLFDKKFLVILFFLPMAGGFCIADAQRPKTFWTNGRTIAVDTLNRQIIHMMDEVGVPGMSFAVIENNKIAFYNTYGVRAKSTGRKLNKKTVFMGCSLSKSFLVFIACQLVDEGKLDLDKPVYQYLKNDQLEYDPRYKLITSRMILSHSSGLENWQVLNDPSKLEIISNPGEAFVYSGEGYEYLARIIEKLLNQSYEEYIRDREFKPLKIRNTYLKFKKNRLNLFHKESPWNYVVGHGIDSKPLMEKEYVSRPAYGNYITAEDYAKLILAIFDTAHLSVSRIKDLEKPIVSVNNSPIYYGPGFEVAHLNGDVIISHGGDGPGIKNFMYYSVVNKRGFVFLTNSERGRFMVEKLCALSVRMNIDVFLNAEFDFAEQYPSNASRLLKIYDDQGIDAMYAEIEKLKRSGGLTSVTLDVVSYFFRWYTGGSIEVAKRLLGQNIILFPDSPLSYTQLGEIYLGLDKPDSALLNLRKARNMNYTLLGIDNDIKECETKLAEFERTKDLLVRIDGNGQTTIRAENYNIMSGVRVEKSSDEGGGQDVGHTDPGDWMDYRVYVPAGGTYSVTFRVSSLWEGGQLELRLGDTVLTKMNIEATKSWEKWTSEVAEINFPAGSHTLRLYVRNGDFKIGWLKFAFVRGNKYTAIN